MKWLLHLLAFVAVMAPVVIVANLIAQRLKPTLTSDSFGNRYAYTLLTRFLGSGLLAVTVGVLWLVGVIR